MKHRSRIRELRKASGLGRGSAAKRAGVPFSTLDGWEQYGLPGQVATACRIAAALGVRVDELFEEPPEIEQ